MRLDLEISLNCKINWAESFTRFFWTCSWEKRGVYCIYYGYILYIKWLLVFGVAVIMCFIFWDVCIIWAGVAHDCLNTYFSGYAVL